MGSGQAESLMEKENYTTQMEPTMLAILIKAMRTGRADLWAQRGGFMKASYRISKPKAKEYFTTKIWSTSLKVHGQGIFQTDMGESNGKARMFCMRGIS